MEFLNGCVNNDTFLRSALEGESVLHLSIRTARAHFANDFVHILFTYCFVLVLIMSRAHYSVNDDVYGKILKTHTDLEPQTDYAEVFEACEGLGIPFPF